MGILNAAVYGGGLLADRTGERTTYGYRRAPPELSDAVSQMRRVCTEHGTDLTTAALQFSLRDTRFAATVVGMSRTERVAQTLEAASSPVPETLWPELAALLPPEHAWLDAPFGG
jgi:D-threo-aldose 1-dehydrogenase